MAVENVGSLNGFVQHWRCLLRQISVGLLGVVERERVIGDAYLIRIGRSLRVQSSHDEDVLARCQASSRNQELNGSFRFVRGDVQRQFGSSGFSLKVADIRGVATFRWNIDKKAERLASRNRNRERSAASRILGDK